MPVSIDIQRGTVNYVPPSVMNYLRNIQPDNFDASLITNSALFVTVTGDVEHSGGLVDSYLRPLINRRLKLEVTDSSSIVAVFTRVFLADTAYNDEHYLWYNTLFAPAFLHHCCVNCRRSMVFHQGGRCLFDSTSLQMGFQDKLGDSVVFTLDKEPVPFSVFIGRL